MHRTHESGMVVWLTGLSGAGKSTIARAAEKELLRQGKRVELLDGDVIRETFSKGLGFSKADRDENVRRTACVAALVASHGVTVIVSLISPYRNARKLARKKIEQAGIPFLEVFVNAPINVCAWRDPKGLYRKAKRGEIPAFTGVVDPYEEPRSPDVECRTDQESVEISTGRVLEAIGQLRASAPKRARR